MTWVAPFQGIRDRIYELVTESGLPVLWWLHVDNKDDGDPDTIGDGGRPDTFHVIATIVPLGANPLEVGWALESAGGTPPDETTGEVQFDFYSPAQDGEATVYITAQTIRAKFRGVEDSGVRYGVPLAPQPLGVESGWARWVMRVPFTIEDA